ncbi:Hydroxyisobutyryl-CoA Hydrolase [Klebsormidium nitens]|uniref:3-hydroxyisobutyryl-CoA hydrolase n=1 Tax=Klebsormidium nitens TaxID=105231 RepID=A0A1Y1I9P5_KLENI|nr:Hydroxyisobutyryl-CoA Hydrolase [Klebsormidium nitens]|eukprot:GAQ87660.1 Hydroxyisobutyryl-CoA Hydrolase [Klebsormidium nitens]
MASAAEPEVLEEAFGPVRVVTLNRPKALNALNTPMMKQLARTLRNWEARPHARVIILKGAGPPGRAYCAGGDVRAVYEMGKAGRHEECKQFFRWEYNVNNFLAEMQKPVIAWMDGVTMGGGCGVSINGPIRIATENTVCAMPECAIGLHPDVGASWFLNHRSPLLRDSSIGMYLALTGARLDGANMVALGLATHWMPSERLPLLIERLGALRDFSRDGIESVLYEITERPTVDQADPNVSILARRKVIDECFANYSVEHIIGALRKAAREPGNKWVEDILASMQKASPTSLKITHRSIERGRSLTLSKALKTEFRLTYRCLEKPDFYEGVRAMLVDKDMKPKWQPKALTEVKAGEVAWYASPLPEGEELEFELEKMLAEAAAKNAPTAKL